MSKMLLRRLLFTSSSKLTYSRGQVLSTNGCLLCRMSLMKVTPIVPIKQNVLYNSSKTDNVKKEEKKIQAMPGRLTKLITDTRDGGWPSLSKVTMLIEKCSLAGVTGSQVEQFLITHFRSKSKESGAGKNRQPNFYSYHLLNRWQREESRTEILDKFLSYFRTNVLEMEDKQKLPIKRAEYCIAVWRLAIILHDSIKSENELAKIEQFVSEMSVKDPNLSILLDLCHLVQKKDITVSVPLLDFVTNVSDCNIQKSADLPCLLISPDLKSATLDHLLDQIIISPFDRVRLLLARTTLSWSRQQISTSLENLSAATTLFLDLITNREDVDNVLNISVLPLVETWQQIGQKVPPGPATDYLITLTEMMSSKYPGLVGHLPTYILWLSTRDKVTTLSNLLETKVLANPRLRADKFERCFLVKSMTAETKTFFMVDYFQRIVLDSKEQLVTHSQSSDSKSEKPMQSNANKLGMEKTADGDEAEKVNSEQMEVSDNQTTKPNPIIVDIINDSEIGISDQLLEISILELVSTRKSKELVDLILMEVRKGQLPSASVLKGVSQLLVETGDLVGLDNIHRSLPVSSQQRETVYLALGRLRLNNISSGWEAGKKVINWIRLVELYRSGSRDKMSGEILLQTGDFLLGTARRHIKLCVEEAVLLDGGDTEELMRAVRAGVGRISVEFADLGPTLLLWEAFFFAPSWELQQEADDIIKEVPSLVSVVNIDDILARCASSTRYKGEENYRRLVEVCLRNDAPPYIKSRVFEELLAFQTRSSNIMGGSQTIKTAKSLDIRITADFLQAYLAVKQEMETDTSQKFVSKIKRFFTTDEKK